MSGGTVALERRYTIADLDDLPNVERGLAVGDESISVELPFPVTIVPARLLEV